MKKISYVALMLILVGLAPSVKAQEAEETDTGYNPRSTKNIHDSDIMYKQEIWRRFDSKEPMNSPYYATGNEITKLIIDAVKAGTLKPYFSDSLNKEMPLEEFDKRLIIPGVDNPADAAPVEDNSGWGPAAGTTAAPAGPATNTWFPREISVLILKEDLIFDKKRSRMYNDIQAITLVVPGEKVATALDVNVATFAYKDLVELFRSKPKEAVWFNRKNSREHKNYADAFELRLFHARLIRISNPNGSYIEDSYENRRNALLASEALEQELMEYEHNLWEY
jgi:gliding motility associated protien GldN